MVGLLLLWLRLRLRVMLLLLCDVVVCVWVDVHGLVDVHLRLLRTSRVHGIVLRIGLEAIADGIRHHADRCHSN